ncbi:MAG: hypothetical protein ACD_4C00489G0003 [uncultured bacterium (gcode 4)]|uniref:Uncharacterized protein n=1 Tax=uncultured bacterium (gcode 4) TaxID=1234023 RepID=K2F469_9BACT|nr:MAG: hypothetical protein ACD_4C00489G0003 [uncultured bacterium (gcode 4)]
MSKSYKIFSYMQLVVLTLFIAHIILVWFLVVVDPNSQNFNDILFLFIYILLWVSGILLLNHNKINKQIWIKNIVMTTVLTTVLIYDYWIINLI